MPQAARTDRNRRPFGALLAAVLAATSLLPSAGSAAPIDLSTDQGLAEFTAAIVAYRDASRVGWRVEGGTADDRERLVRQLQDALGPGDADLLEKVAIGGTIASTRALSQLSAEPAAKAGPRAVIAIAPAPADPCSWRVSLSDPAVPGGIEATTTIPLETGDRLPASIEARFEIGFSGPLQSTLYAFGERAPGVIRDLAAAPEIAIAVADEAETLVLVRARRPVPYLDGVRGALADRPGAVKALGRDYELTARLRQGARGVGANIQLVDPGMIVASNDQPAEGTTAPVAPPPRSEGLGEVPVADAGDLAETCLYTITPMAAAMR